LIAIGAIVGVIVLALAAIGIFLLVKPEDHKAGPTMTTASTTKSPEHSTPTRTRNTTEPTPTENPDSFQAKLMALIPTGYPTSVCQAASPPSPGALATIDCDKSVQPGGPEAARYSIFADKDQLTLHFNESLKENEETLRCPGADADSPIDWNFKANPDDVAGQVACGTYKGNADVMWTQYDQLLLADVQSTDMNSLHDWWLNYS
jgi:serine/threonine-protein kinase